MNRLEPVSVAHLAVCIGSIVLFVGCQNSVWVSHRGSGMKFGLSERYGPNFEGRRLHPGARTQVRVKL